MSSIAAIALNTFKEAIRNRILYIILIFALVLMGCSGVISDLSIANQDRLIKDLGLASINFFGLLIAVFIGIGLVYNELDKKTIYTIVSKPIDRYQFILGKYFGLMLTILVNVFIMTFFFLLVIHFQQLTSEEVVSSILYTSEGGEWKEIENARWIYLGYMGKSFLLAAGRALSNLVLWIEVEATRNIMQVVAFTVMELALITAITVFFSSFTTPTLAAIFTILTFVAGRLNEDIIRYAERLEKLGLTSVGTQVKYYFAWAAAVIVPNLGLFNRYSEAIHAENVGISGVSIAYCVLYTAAILCFAIVIFQRRNFK